MKQFKTYKSEGLFLSEKTLRALLEPLRDQTNEIADEYFRRHFFRYLETLKRIPVYKGMKVLDIGTLPGTMPTVLKRLGAVAYGIDIDPDRYGFSKKMRSEGISLLTCNFAEEQLPFSDEMFDIILFTEVIEHMLTDPQKILNEIYRVLRTDGLLVVTTPNVASLRNRLKLLLGKNVHPKNFYTVPYLYQRHYYEYTMSELEDRLGRAGFSIQTKAYLPAYERALRHKLHSFGVRQNLMGRIISLVYSHLVYIIPAWKSFIFIAGIKK